MGSRRPRSRGSGRGFCVFQIAYYDSLLTTRSVLLQQSGHTVSSVLGNEQAKAAAGRLLSDTDVVVIGFSGSYQQRAEMLRWLKEQDPEIPVLVLQSHASEAFAEADGIALAEAPETWLAAVTACVKGRKGPNFRN